VIVLVPESDDHGKDYALYFGFGFSFYLFVVVLCTYDIRLGNDL
jgi:hypothetical protein